MTRGYGNELMIDFSATFTVQDLCTFFRPLLDLLMCLSTLELNVPPGLKPTQAFAHIRSTSRSHFPPYTQQLAPDSAITPDLQGREIHSVRASRSEYKLTKEEERKTKDTSRCDYPKEEMTLEQTSTTGYTTGMRKVVQGSG